MAAAPSDWVSNHSVEELLFKAAHLLDEGRVAEWIELFTETAQYEMLFQNKEIGGVDDYMIKLNKVELVKRMTLVPNYVLDTVKRLHMVSNIHINLHGKAAAVRSNFVVYRTTETGRTSLYAIGHSEDEVVETDGSWLFQKRRVVLDTRLLEVHTHLPLQ